MTIKELVEIFLQSKGGKEYTDIGVKSSTVAQILTALISTGFCKSNKIGTKSCDIEHSLYLLTRIMGYAEYREVLICIEHLELE